jgi:diguanylate cyclase
MPDIRTPAPSSLSEPAQEELLRRGLVRVSIAADGQTPLLDRRLKELRQALRADAPTHRLVDLLPDLEQAVLAADEQRQERLRQISQTLKDFARQMQKQERGSDAHAALRQLLKRLDTPLTYLDEIPDLVSSLAAVQGLAAGESASPASRGLWSKLFGAGDDLKSPAAEAPLPAEADAAELAEQEAKARSSEEIEDPDTATTASDAQNVVSQPVNSDSLDAQQYSAVSAHIETALIGLLDELEIVENQSARHERVRQQVRDGLNWYELAPVLDDVSVLVLAAQRNRQSEFERYLQQLNSRLAQFQGNLEQAHDAYSGSLDSGRNLEVAIRSQVQTLHEDVTGSTDLNLLKANVQAKLDALLADVDKARVLREQRESEVASHLKTMVDRIQVMEVEAQTFRHHLEEQTRRAMLDHLTGLPNRAGLQKRMEEEFDRWKRYGGQLLVAVLDVDHFKAINDSFGHLAGDKVLRLIAQQLQRRLRKTDFIGRFGGEEFVLLMPGTTLEQGGPVLEELRAGISECPFHFKSQRVTITISLGYTAVKDGDELDQAFDRADQAMYRAKSAGRNRIVRAD